LCPADTEALDRIAQFVIRIKWRCFAVLFWFVWYRGHKLRPSTPEQLEKQCICKSGIFFAGNLDLNKLCERE